MVTFGFTLVSWGFVCLLISALYPLKAPGTPGRGMRAMSRLGQNSYAFYLWHGPVILASDSFRPWLAARGYDVSLFVVLIATFVVSCLMAEVTTRLLETPSLRLRDRLFPASAKTEVPAPVVLRPRGVKRPAAA